MAHTKGPWRATVGHNGQMSSVYKASDKDFQIATVVCEARNKEQRKQDIANANLIASAPELLEALIAARGALFYQIEAKHGPEVASKYPEITLADAAIKKASWKS